MRRETERINDFKNIPNNIENKTRPFLYSFLRGLKNVLKSSPIDKRDATYLLKLAKKDMKFLVRSTYQNDNK